MSDIVISLVVSPIIQEALSKAVSFATSFARTHIQISWDLKTQMRELEYSLSMMQDLLKVAEDREKRHDAVRTWLQRVEDEAHNLVDILDKYSYDEVHQQKVGTKNPIKKQVLTFSPLFSSMPCEIRTIRESLDNIRLDATFINLLHNHATLSQDPIETTPYSSDNSEVLGRDDDVSNVVSLLSELSRQNPLSGLSIVGMPGIGKTALARSICKRAKEENLYDLVAWVCLSKKFDEKMILKGLLEYLDSNGGSMDNTGAILNRLETMLEKKRFLLVLDDVWNGDSGRWKILFSYLLGILKTTGNSIVVTTSRKQVVASTAVKVNVPMHKYELQKLSDEGCRLIMEEKILRSSRITTIPMALLDIAKHCGGLPLVAAVIGETLSHHTDADEWLAIKNNTAWDSPHRMEIVSELKKSFDRLPSPLKKCFSYCSIFPKDSEIRRDEVVQLWMAKGFLYQPDGSKSDEQEDVGDRYLKDLVSNFLFQDVKMDEYGNIVSFKMHDEVHNLALSLSTDKTYIWPDTCSIDCSCIRHLRVVSDANFSPLPEGVPERLHSLFLDVDVFRTMASELSSLRSLKLAAAGKEDLEGSLRSLKYYIKYLDISKIDIQGLPDFVTKLYNLQTLRVPGCKSLRELPTGIENLVRLRHIYFNNENHMPSSIGKLTALQTLQLFVVGEQEGRRIEELKCLNQLRGKLKIGNLEKVSESEATKAKLEEKVHLIELQFVWSKSRANSNNDKSVLEGLRPHSNLKSLTFENYRGSDFPSWMVKDVSGSVDLFRLNNLVNLELLDCDECCNISSLGLLPELKVLHISAMSKVERIGSKFYQNRSSMASSSQVGGQSITLFPALIRLFLQNMTKLKEWTEEQGLVVFPCLEQLHIGDCPEFETWWTDGSASHKLSELTILACPKLQVIPSGMLNLKSLNIEDCHNLKEYAQRYSPKWDSICHIPHIKINGEVVQSQDS
ncbi:hypothetical protein SLA2020_432440 [Shorea laevis]